MDKIYDTPELLLRELLRFETVNPPGNERACVEYIKGLLDAAGIETRLYALDEARPNLWAEIKSESPAKPGVLMYGHIDVVPAESRDWVFPPFEGVISDGCIYGRGAIDMKSAIAIFLCVMLKIKHEGKRLDFDLRLLILSDEENTGEYGAKFMVEKHAGLFENIGCAFGEMGGFSHQMRGKRFYPVMIAEKQCSTIRLRFRGKSGHGSSRHYGTAMEKMSGAVSALSRHRLKTRVVPEVSFMIREFAKGLGGMRGFLMRLMLAPLLTDTVLNIMRSDGVFFDNLLHNSLNVTIVNGGGSINVIPAEVCALADLRILPGCTIETALEDVSDVLLSKAGLSGADFELEVVEFDENNFRPRLDYFGLIKQTMLEMDPEGIPVPFVFGAVTDARILSKAGVMTYGFVPMRLPEHFNFFSQAHAENEHIPISALAFGIDALLLFLGKL